MWTTAPASQLWSPLDCGLWEEHFWPVWNAAGTAQQRVWEVWQLSNLEIGPRFHFGAADGRDELCCCLGSFQVPGCLCRLLDLVGFSIFSEAWGFFITFFPALCFASASIPAWNRSHVKYPHSPFQAIGIRNTLPLCLSQPSDLCSRAGSREGKGRKGRRKRKPFTPPFQPEAGACSGHSDGRRSGLKEWIKKDDKRCSLPVPCYDHRGWV